MDGKKPLEERRSELFHGWVEFCREMFREVSIHSDNRAAILT